MHLHKSKHTKFKQLKYKRRHSLSNKHRINKQPNVNQYKSIYLAEIKSQVQYILFIFVLNKIHKKYNVQIHTHINIVKDNNTIIESIKKIIQNDNIKPILYKILILIKFILNYVYNKFKRTPKNLKIKIKLKT